jgi:hypothetical protein
MASKTPVYITPQVTVLGTSDSTMRLRTFLTHSGVQFHGFDVSDRNCQTLMARYRVSRHPVVIVGDKALVDPRVEQLAEVLGLRTEAAEGYQENPFPNKFAAPCGVCKVQVQPGEGMTKGPPWVTTCRKCLEKTASPAKIGVKMWGSTEVAIKPMVFLGGDMFAKYRTATSGSSYDAPRKQQVARLDQLPMVLDALINAGFVVEVDPAVQEAVRGVTASMKADVVAADTRMAQVDAWLAARGKKLFPFQRQGVSWLSPRHSGALFDDMGLGKQHPVDTKVLTPKGYRCIGDLAVGDEVIGSNGKPTRVSGIFPQGVKPSYRVLFSDGSSVEAGPEHLWTLMYYCGGRHLEEITVTTEQMRVGAIMREWPDGSTSRMSLAKASLYLPMLSGPVEFRSVEPLPMSAYLVGQLIANGSLARGTPVLITHTSDWIDISRRLTSEGVNIGSVSVYGNATRANILGVVEIVRTMGLNVLSGEKRIPNAYMHASVVDRVSLLQGLMDGDGSCSSTRNKVTYHTTSEGLAEDVRELVEQLGGIARIHAYDRSHDKKPTDYQISIRLPLTIEPFSTSRKSKRLTLPRRRPCRTFVSASYVRDVESVCIRVEAEDRLYATEHAILTHNTIQVLAALPDNAPVVIVAPAVAKGVWKREFSSWRPDYRVTVLSGRGSFRWPASGEAVIVNYDILPEAKKMGEYTPPLSAAGLAPPGTVLVADEAHALKSSKTKRHVNFRGLAEAAFNAGGRVWLLTATPMLNEPPEIWHLLQVAHLEKEAFGSWGTFVDLFGGRKGRYGMEWGDWRSREASPEIGDRLKRVSLRRRKKEVLPELPVKTYGVIPVDLDAKTGKALDKIVAEAGIDLDKAIEEAISTSGKRIAFKGMSHARDVLATAKIPAMLEVVEEFEENAEPLLVFSAHRAPVDTLAKRPGWAVITGDTPPAKRTEIEDAFQRGELKGVAATIAAGGVAITLTRSSNALFVDKDWTPALNVQAEDRLCRIGQTRGCIIKTLEADHVLDARVNELLDKKAALIGGTVEQVVQPIEAPVVPTIIEVDFAKLAIEVEKATRLEEERAKEEAKRAGAPKPTVFRPAKTPMEEWASKGLQQLAVSDQDFAREKNHIGFNRLDGSIGHKLAAELARRGLSDAQWNLAVKLVRKYHGQIGEPPVE